MVFHKDLAQGRWEKMTLAEQLSQIGAEVGRAAKQKGKDEKLFRGAVMRALELFDLTLKNKHLKGRLWEIGRLRELFLTAIEDEDKYKTSLSDLEKYFLPYMFLIRKVSS